MMVREILIRIQAEDKAWVKSTCHGLNMKERLHEIIERYRAEYGE